MTSAENEKARARMSTRELMERLRRHYIKPGQHFPGGIFLPECGLNGQTGSRVDALYVGFTSTSGRRLVGHEVKVSRADWRKELDTAGKADLWADNCHQWYIVAPGPEVAPREEIPHGWGLMYPSTRTKTRMDVVVKAPVTERDPSWLVVRSIMARLDTLQVGRIDELRRTALDDARKQVEQERANRPDPDRRLTNVERERLACLDRIEESLGRSVVGWRSSSDDKPQLAPEEVAAVVRLVETGSDLARSVGTGLHQTAALRHAANRLTKGLDDWDAVLTALSDLVGQRR